MGASYWRVAMRRYSRSWSAIVGKPPASSAASSDPCFLTIAAARPGPTPGAPGIRSDGSPRKAMKSGTCSGLDAVALPHLGRPDALELRHAALRVQDRRPRRGQLKEIAIVRQHERRALALLLRSDGGREEVVRLVAGFLRPGKAERLDEVGEPVELVGEIPREVAPRLVRGEELVAVRRHGERVEGDENRARLLGLPRADEHVREADDHVRRLAVPALDGARKRVVGAVRQVVAVDCQ